MFSELQAACQKRNAVLQAEIMQAFQESLHADVEKKLPTPVPPQLPTPVSPQPTPESLIQHPVVQGSPVTVVVTMPPDATPRHSPILKPDNQSSPGTTTKPSTPAARSDVEASGLSNATQDGAKGRRFEIICGTGIVLNALVMLLEEQYNGLNAGFKLGAAGFDESGSSLAPWAESAFQVMNISLNLTFTLELICRLHRVKWGFYRSPWLWLDLFIVPSAWLDQLQVFGPSTPAAAMIRICRVFRLFQLIPLMQCNEKLRLMVRSIKASFSILGWCIVMILFTQVAAGLCLQYTLSDFYEDTSKPENIRQEVFQRFGTTSRTLLTMFQVVFANWSQPCWMLVLNVSEWYGFFFVLYRCVLGFALLRVVSSMFNAEIQKLCSQDVEVAALKKKHDEEVHKSQLREMFSIMGKSGYDKVSWCELNEMLQNPKFVRYVKKIGINPFHLTQLFKILSRGGSSVHDSQVELEEFMSGVMEVEGTAKAIDILALSKSLERLSFRLDSKELSEKLISYSETRPFESVLQQASPSQMSMRSRMTV